MDGIKAQEGYVSTGQGTDKVAHRGVEPLSPP
jgi:hypothetical protein